MSPRPRRRGLGLVEVLVVLLLMSIILVVAFGVMQSGSREQKLVADYADIAYTVRRAVKQLEKDLRGARAVTLLQRGAARTLSRLEIEVPISADPLDGFTTVSYRFDPTERVLERDGRPLLRSGVTGIEMYVFDDLGRELNDEGASFTAFTRLRFELGDPEDPPARRRRLDLTLSPRLLASQAKAERLLLERAFERFGGDEANEDSDFGRDPGRRRF